MKFRRKKENLKETVRNEPQICCHTMTSTYGKAVIKRVNLTRDLPGTGGVL